MPEQIASELPAGAVADGAATLTALTAAADTMEALANQTEIKS